MSKLFKHVVFLLVLISSVHAVPAAAEQNPRVQMPAVETGTIETATIETTTMEAGIGLVSQFNADYRGSTYYSFEALPLPYFLYSGKIFKVDRNGVRGEFIANPRYELNVSVDGSLSGNSDENPVREGMPELDSTFEFGPSFNVNLTGQDFHQGWSLRLPLRAVFSVGSGGVDYVGYLFNPRFTWRKSELMLGWRLSYNLGLLLADTDYHAYYYGVKPEYARSWRPEYRAGSGYSGTFMRIGLYRRVEAWRFGMSVRYDNLSGASIEDSPLVETDHYGSIALGITRRFWTGGHTESLSDE